MMSLVKALLITGGATGVTGTILLVDAFRFLGDSIREKQAGAGNALLDEPSWTKMPMQRAKYG